MLSSWLMTAYLLSAAIISTSAIFFDHFMEENQWEKVQRLPTAVIPTNYWVILKPNIHVGKFSGNVQINITCKETTNVIVLHAHKSLHIDTKFVILIPEWSNVHTMIETAQQMFSNSTHANIASIKRNATNDELIITLVQQMHVGDSYQLYIEFSGEMKLSDLSRGYQPSNENCGLLRAKNDVAANSSFIMTDMSLKCARRVFPCFDEPSFKTSFKISVARPENMTAVSVMPVEYSEEGEKDWIWDHFAPSPPISTFSINIFITDLKISKTFNVRTRYGKFSIQYHQTQHSNKTMSKDVENMIPRTIKFLEDYLGIEFPVPKLDILVLPNNIYSQINTLGTICQTNYMMKYDTLFLIPSLIDQWVLHTVTPQWWNNLNITNMLGLYLTKVNLVNIIDNPVWYAISTYEMYKFLGNPIILQYYEKIHYIYDIYKGDWFLQMLRTSISENTLKNGLNKYFSNNIYGTYNKTKLWNSLSKQAWEEGTLQHDISVETLANSWLNKPLFPMVTVNRNYEENSATMDQHVFMQKYNRLQREYQYKNDPSLDHIWTEEEKQMKWWIPISSLTPHNTEQSTMLPSEWMKEESQLNVTNLPNHDKFVIINPMDSGMFLVNYDQQNWNLIMQTLISDKNKLPILTRKKVLLDASLLATNGNLSYVTFLNISLFLFNETEPLVWNAFVNVMLMDTEQTFLGTSVEQKLNHYLRKLVIPFYNSLKQLSNKDKELTRPLQDFQIKQLLERIGYQPYINETHKTVDSKLPTYPIEDAQTQLIIFCPYFLNISEDTNYLAYAGVLYRYAQQLEYNYKMFWRTSLSSCPGYDNFIYKILNDTLNEEKIYGDSDWQIIIDLIKSNPTAHSISLNFLLLNYDELKQRLSNDHMIQFVTTVLNNIRSEEQLQVLLEFYQQHEHDTGHIHNIITESIKDVYKSVESDKQHLSDILYWFDEILPKFVQF